MRNLLIFEGCKRRLKMSNTEGYIYILTNPSFPPYVKIGYANNVEARVKK